MYTLIGQGEFEKLRRERLAALELDHYRTCLLLQEATSSHEQEALHMELAELERRMSIHQPHAERPEGEHDGAPNDGPGIPEDSSDSTSDGG